MSLTWWMRWKSLKLPWRKKILAGVDLEGNTYWELRERAAESTKPRRMAQYLDRDVHHSDVNVSPQWMQWLRHTRKFAPTLEEQEQDIVRQQQLRQLAEAADARWAAQPSYLVAPNVQAHDTQAAPMTAGGGELLDEAARRFGISPTQFTSFKTETIESPNESHKTSQKVKEQSPWDAAQKTKDEPDAWKPKTLKR